jgi:holliday junction DNA helicase RuvA
MISFVRGTVASVGATQVVIDVGGVGLALHCTPTTTASLHTGATAQLSASLIVREDSMTLFGFADDDERAVFELLQTASGVGPRLALAMLAVHSPDDLRRAVAAEDLVALTRVPGIGKKGAQRIVIELKDKLGAAASLPSSANGSPVPTAARADAWRDQVHAGLIGLGWSAREADAAVEAVAPLADDGVGPDVPALLRAALRSLAKT